MAEKLLLHLSFDYVDIKDFKLRVPLYRLPSEDSTTKRICFSETLEGCINSMPHGAKGIRGMLKASESYGIKVRMYIYMAAMNDNNSHKFIRPEEVTRKGVVDALINREHWAIDKIDGMVYSSIIINSAAFYEVHDHAERSKLMVKSVDYEMADTNEHEQLFIEKVFEKFKENGITIRDVTRYTDEYKSLDAETREKYNREVEKIIEIEKEFKHLKDGGKIMDKDIMDKTKEEYTIELMEELIKKMNDVEKKINLFSEKEVMHFFDLQDRMGIISNTLEAHSVMFGQIWANSELIKNKS